MIEMAGTFLGSHEWNIGILLSATVPYTAKECQTALDGETTALTEAVEAHTNLLKELGWAKMAQGWYSRPKSSPACHDQHGRTAAAQQRGRLARTPRPFLRREGSRHVRCRTGARMTHVMRQRITWIWKKTQGRRFFK